MEAQLFLFFLGNLFRLTTEAELVDKLVEGLGIVFVCKLDAKDDLLQWETVELLTQLAVVFGKVNVELQLKQKLGRVDIEQPEIPRL